MNADLRIGHCGLERREVDDTFWLNGTRIDEGVYNLELQRIIAHQQVTDEAKLVRELQQQAASQHSACIAHMRRAEDMQNSYAGLATAVYGLATLGATSTRATEPPPKQQPPFKLSLKTSPIFAPPKWAGLYWNFDSPFKPLADAFIRWAWKHTRNRVHA